MLVNEKEYELLQLLIRPCFVFIEGEKKEDYWVDDQNAVHYYLEDDDDDIPGTIKETGKKHWIIQAVKPKGIKITDDNEDLVKYIVWLGPKDDLHKEWDFDKHCPICIENGEATDSSSN